MANTELGFVVRQMTPTAIDKSNPVRVTVVSNGLTNDQYVRATDFVTSPVFTGMQELNNQLFMIGQVTADTFDLFDQYGSPIDGTSYTTFVDIGLAKFTLTGPALYTQNLNTRENI